MTVTTLDAMGRLLPGNPDGPHPSDLAAHLTTHGRLPLPAGDDPRWGEAVWRGVEASGLLGRGGAGFPASAKWDRVRRSGRRPVVVVNAMEGEPASAKDGVLLTCSPHLVLDGAEVAAAVVGADEIVICVAEHAHVAAASVDAALAERGAAGGSRTRTTVVRPPGRYVAGEESALVSWLNDRPARPALRIDKSVPLRVRRRPTVVHNAETLAHVALIVRHGPEWFRSMGTPEAPGSTLVTVGGAVRVRGVVEIAIGTPVIDILDRAGLESDVAGVLVGGYGGAWLDPSRLTTPYAPGPLADAGTAPGVGILVALPPGSCGIAETARIVRYMAAESAGQCGPCVFGLPAIADDLERLWAGRAETGLLGRILRRSATVDGRGACRHPDGVVRLVRSALTVFEDDARAHAAGRACPGHASPTVLPSPSTMGSPPQPDPGPSPARRWRSAP